MFTSGGPASPLTSSLIRAFPENPNAYLPAPLPAPIEVTTKG